MNIVNPRSRIMDLVTQTLERLDFEAEAIKKDDVKFYEYLISTAILHDLASRFYKDPRMKSSFGSGSKKTDVVLNQQRLGKWSTANNPCLRSGLKLQMKTLEVLKAQLGDVRRKATPFISAKALLIMRDIRFCSPGEKREKLLLLCWNPRERIELSLKNAFGSPAP